MPLYIFSFILSFLLSSSSTQAAFVDQAKVQYAGEIGILSFGLGRTITKNYSFDILYGYVPESEAGKEIETYSFKNDYKFFRYEKHPYLMSIYMGVNVYHVIGLRYQTSRFASYPRNYYRISSIRTLLYLGVELETQSNRNSFFFESGMNDIWIINYYNNQNVLDPKDYISLATGWNHTF